MNESNHKQKIVTILVDIAKGENKMNLIEYPELNALFDEGMYIESFNQCTLSDTKFYITFILRFYHSA